MLFICKVLDSVSEILNDLDELGELDWPISSEL